MNLNLPLRNELTEKFERAIDEEFRKCSRIIEQYKRAEYRENLAEEFNSNIEKLGFGNTIQFLSKECKIPRTD